MAVGCETCCYRTMAAVFSHVLTAALDCLAFVWFVPIQVRPFPAALISAKSRPTMTAAAITGPRRGLQRRRACRVHAGVQMVRTQPARPAIPPHGWSLTRASAHRYNGMMIGAVMFSLLAAGHACCWDANAVLPADLSARRRALTPRDFPRPAGK